MSRDTSTNMCVHTVMYCIVKRSAVWCKANLVGASIFLATLITSATSIGIW